MNMIYAIAAISLVFVSYLLHDFYQEQVRVRPIPVRPSRNGNIRRVRNHRAW